VLSTEESSGQNALFAHQKKWYQGGKEYGVMIKVNIFYPNKEGGRFDLDYY
jgi:hypothetical protein